jgi:crotonobetainyl-CoA:carnitine CoA-transferase CaiB-like acyl-CoA transferase
MKKFVFALAALATLAFAAPSFAATASAAPGAKVVRVDSVGHHRGHTVKKVVVRRGHPGWRAHRHGRKVVVVKHRRPHHHGKTVVIKHRR